MKKTNSKIFAYCCILAAILITFAVPAPVKTVEPDAGSEYREDKIEMTPMEKIANELTLLIGNKLADLMDEIAASVENRAERKKSRRNGENNAGGTPHDPEEGQSERENPISSGFAEIFSTLMREAANSVREHLNKKVLPKLQPKDLLVKIPTRTCRAVT